MIGRLLRFAGPPPDPMPVVHMIDQIWCDKFGVFVRGWMHAHGHKVTEIALVSGEGRTATQSFHARPDLLAHYPDHPHVAETGFELYLPCQPFEPVFLEAVTAVGARRVKVAVPPHLQTEAEADWLDVDHPWVRFVVALRESGGKVLEVGSRVVGTHTASTDRNPFGPTCTKLGCDIHPGQDVDFVVDVHALSSVVPMNSLAGVFSVAVLEHLAAPWVAAAEINRCLQMGGLTLHLTMQAWPIHEQPNDFWRMSDRGLATLFGPATGFEVMEAGMRGPLRMHPSPEMRKIGWLDMPTSEGFGESFVLARKVAEVPAGAVAWPIGGDRMGDVSRSYPVRAPMNVDRTAPD